MDVWITRAQGIHLHCWGGSLNGGYGWWYQAEQGHLLIASNQIPYDWWTGYHERYFDGPPDDARMTFAAPVRDRFGNRLAVEPDALIVQLLEKT